MASGSDLGGGARGRRREQGAAVEGVRSTVGKEAWKRLASMELSRRSHTPVSSWARTSAHLMVLSDSISERLHLIVAL